MSSWLGRGLLAAGAVAMAVWCAANLRIVNDVSSFMPASGSTELASLSRALTDSELTRSMVLCIGAPDAQRAVRAARSLESALREQPEVAWLRSGVAERQLEEVYDLYFPRRLYFLSDAPQQELSARLSDAGLRESARRLRAELARPGAALVAKVAGDDPLLVFPALARRLAAGDRKLRLHDGAFVDAQGRHAFLFLGTRSSPFETDRQSELLAAIDDRFAAIAAEQGPGLTLEKAGMNRFVYDTETSIRGEIPLLFGFSTLAVAVLFLVFFRSPRALLLAMLPHALGFLVAATVGLALFGALNGLAIAFGACLVGVTIDYAIHLLNHHALAPPGTPPAATLREVRPSLVLGGGTTIASFAGLAFADFPGFHQMGVLAAVGVTAALAASLFLLPGLMGEQRAPRASRRAAAWLGSRTQRLARFRRELALLSVACAALALWGMPRIRWIDDFSRLTTMNPALVAEEQRVRERISSADASRFLIASGDSLEAALVANDRLHARLLPLVRDGTLAGFRSLHAYLWSEALQRENLALLRADPGLPERLERAYTDLGFRPGSFQGFAAALAGPEPEPLRFADLAGSGLGDAVRPLVLELGGRTGVVTLLEGVQRPEALAAAVAEQPGVRLFDQKRFFRDVYGEYRRRIVGVVVSGCFAGLALLVLRYRALRPALAAALPSLLVAGLLVAIAAATGTQTHVLHLIGLFLVIGIGGDFGIFLVDGVEDEASAGTTMLSLLVASCATILTFGVMGLSAHPVLSAIGRTTAVGIALSFLLAPVSLVLVAGRHGGAANGVNRS